MTAAEAVSSAWCDLAGRYRCNIGSTQDIMQELLQAYGEPHRHYHTLNHIADLLQLLQEIGCSSDRDAVTLAILFHDVVYDPAGQNNEAASANLAVARLISNGFPAALVADVERYILATRHGAAPPPVADADLQLLLDLDLSVLAAPPARYHAYAKAIRKEYAAVPDELYRRGRRGVLETFLARPQIYLTERLRTMWEASARTNLATEIAELS